MEVKKSRQYLQDDGSKVSFTFDRSDGKIVGVSKDGVPVNPNTSEFSNFTQSADAVAAYNVAKYSSNKRSYVDSVASKTSDELNAEYIKNTKSRTNEGFVENNNNDSTGIAFAQIRNEPKPKKIMQYPFDIDTKQDHLKISRYNYVRPNLNMSKSAGRRVGEGVLSGVTGRESNVTNSGQLIDRTVAGDSVVGSDLKSIILLPMPKVTDVNGVEWGKSELNSSGLTALNITNELTLRGRASGKNEQDRLNDAEIREAISSRREPNSIREGAAALYTGTIAKIAGSLTGADLDADTFLARQGGKVLNPNAEMLFQGPVIRDFGFSFIMIARNQEEGKMIRSIIRELKLGMAPKFRSTTFLTNPDVFMLDYRNGNGTLNTVNRFSPGGLALTTMRVDYAPNGYWSAYRDSQPVAVKMDLDFTELRPIYEGDQKAIEGDNVGY